jgi:hypothetical protein
MRLNLPRTDDWAQLNQSYRQALGLADDPRYSIQIYTSVSHALSEVCTSLSDLIPHKRTVAHFASMGPDFDSVAVTLSKKELTLKKFTHEEILAAEFFTPLAKDLLLLVTGIDDPVTAARHDFNFLTERLKEKKYYHIQLSNFLHAHEPIKLPTHYEVLVLSLTQNRTLVIAGERAKIKPDLTPKLVIDWDPSGEVLNAVQNIFLKKTSAGDEKVQEANARILEFEKNLPSGMRPYFSLGAARVFDRAVVLCEGVDGLSLISRLGEDSNFETTSLCRHFDQKLFLHLISSEISFENLRGMILIDESQLSPEFKKKLTQTYTELLSEQNEVINF